MSHKTPIEVLKLVGGCNLKRALKREEAERNLPPRTQEQKSELETMDALIAQTMRACKMGQTVDGKRNPAFANLATLVKLRKMMLNERSDAKAQSIADIVDDADKILSGVN